MALFPRVLDTAVRYRNHSATSGNTGSREVQPVPGADGALVNVGGRGEGWLERTTLIGIAMRVAGHLRPERRGLYQAEQAARRAKGREQTDRLLRRL